MDDFRVGWIPPYDPVGPHHTDDASGRRKRRHHDQSIDEEDTVTLSEPTGEDQESGTGYGPRREEP